jgi:MFS family permease
MTPPALHSARTAWTVLALVAVANYGNFYVYDSIGPVAELLQRMRGFTDTQLGMLNAVYSLPNIVLLLVGGLMVDRLGIGRMFVWTAAICFVGAVVTALGTGFNGMVAGRFLFGVGAETFNICALAAIVRYAPARYPAFAIGASLAIGRAGAFSVDMSPTWFAGAYAGGWQPPLLIAALLAGVSLLGAAGYAWIDRRERRGAAPAAEAGSPAFAWRDVYRFGRAYWYLVALCALWYAAVFAFRSTFAIKYFQHAHGLDLAAAGAINAYVFLAALVTTPIFGWACDRRRRYAPLLAFGALLLPLAFATLGFTQRSPWLGSALIGVSYSVVPAVMWPLSARVVPAARYGTALGLMWVVQNAAIAGANLVAGQLNDRFGAGAANPAGYQPMMLFFIGCGLVGSVFALLLWATAGRRAQETASRGDVHLIPVEGYATTEHRARN